MKKLLILIATMALSAGAFAQEKMDDKMKMDIKQDHIMMMDGKMQVKKNGKTTLMVKDMTLSNGTKVMKDGTMKTKTGETMVMKEGDVVYMDGKMGKMKMN
jgi:hypothetical protein